MKNKKPQPFTIQDKEAFMGTLETLRDNIQLALEDKSWNPLNMGNDGETLSEVSRAEEVKRSVYSYETFPAYKHAIELDKAFVLGSGIQKPQSNNPLVQWCIDDCWDDPENEETFSGYNAMNRQIDLMQGTGEIFYLIYVNEKTGKAVVRTAQDSLKVKNVITMPGDKDKVLFYEYEMTKRDYNFEAKRYEDKNVTIFVPCILATDEQKTSIIDQAKLKTLAFGYNAKTNTRLYGYLGAYYRGIKGGLRGLPPYRTAYKWTEALKQIVAAAATMAKAKSKIAYKVAFPEGVGKTAMAGVKRSIQAIDDQLGIANVSAADASTLLENTKKGTYEAFDQKLNQQGYRDTQTMLMQQIASAFDKSEHYFGNPENANLATATSMELPVIKSFENIQQLFANTLTKVLKFCVWKRMTIQTPQVVFTNAKAADYDLPEDAAEKQELIKSIKLESWSNMNFKVYMPEMVGKEYDKLVNAVVSGLNAGLIPEKTAAMLVMTALNIENANDVAAEIFGDMSEEDMDDKQNSANTPISQQMNFILEELKKLGIKAPALKPDDTGANTDGE